MPEPETTEAELRQRLDTIRARMAAPGPTPEQLAAGDAEDRALVPRIHAARPGVPTHHILATLQTLRVLRAWEAAKAEPAPAPPVPGLRDQLCDAFIRLIRDYADHSIIAPGYMADTALAVVQPVIDEAQQRAEAMERAMEDTAADALKHRGCHRSLMGQVQRAEQAEAALARVRDLVADMQGVTGARWWAEQLTAALAPPVPADDPEASSAGIDWRDIAAQREEARCAAVSEANRANAVLAAITALAFDADLRPDVRLSRIRNLIDPADGGEQV